MEHSSIITSAQVPMPRLIYGTAWKKDKTSDLVVKAVQYGFRAIDTAGQPKHYNEEGVGDALGKLQKLGISRESLFIQTKFTPIAGQDPLRVPYDPQVSLATQVVQSFANSQKTLGTPYVDSLVLHSPLASHDKLMMVWNAMEKIHEAKGARQLGISNCYELPVLRRLYQDATVKPAVLQNRFYRETKYDQELRLFCADKNIVYQSFWTLSANPDILASRPIRELARELQKTEAQILFRSLTQMGIVPLTGTCSDQHMQEDLAIFNFELSEEHLKGIKVLFN